MFYVSRINIPVPTTRTRVPPDLRPTEPVRVYLLNGPFLELLYLPDLPPTVLGLRVDGVSVGSSWRTRTKVSGVGVGFECCNTNTPPPPPPPPEPSGVLPPIHPKDTVWRTPESQRPTNPPFWKEPEYNPTPVLTGISPVSLYRGSLEHHFCLNRSSFLVVELFEKGKYTKSIRELFSHKGEGVTVEGKGSLRFFGTGPPLTPPQVGAGLGVPVLVVTSGSSRSLFAPLSVEDSGKTSTGSGRVVPTHGGTTTPLREDP